MNLYFCTNCNKKVMLGDAFCSNCGMELEWPKEKRMRRRKSVKLPIDPDNLCRLIGIGSTNHFSVLRRLVVFLFTPPLIWFIFGYREKKINQWLQSLETEPIDLSVFRKHVNSYRRWCIFYIIIAAFEAFAIFLTSFTITGPLAVMMLLMVRVLPSLLVYVYYWKLAKVILADSEGKKTYIYEFEKDTEQHLSQTDDDGADDDDDDDEDDDA